MTTVLVVDDQQMLRLGLRGILESVADITVVGEAGDGREGVRLAWELRPDVILMDLSMPLLDGVGATRELREHDEFARTRILVLTTFENDENVIIALRAGADGFLGKGADPTELLDAVRKTGRGEVAMSSAALRAVVNHVAATPGETEADPALLDQISSLTDREQTVVAGVGEGLTNDQLGRDLFISPFTVKTHLNRAMTKLGVNDRAQVAVLARRAALVYRPD